MTTSHDKDYQFIGEAPAFVRALRLIERVSLCDAPVMIKGETGTGKELAARAIHYSGARRGGPFLPINCGAISESLIERELFGHVRGAFTDASETRGGVIDQAEGGTLFLDEIDGLGNRGQVALLRFLQDLQYRPVGAQSSRVANLRVVAASNGDLAGLVSAGRFRQDLLFRLDVLSVDLPPLRERGGDVILLARTFIDRFCHRYGKDAIELTTSSARWLTRQTWPGNVRQLENLLHRAVLLCEGTLLELDATELAKPATDGGPLNSLTTSDFRRAKASVVSKFELAYLTELLLRTSGNIAEAARLCGQERSQLNKLVRKHGLEPGRFRDRTAKHHTQFPNGAGC